MDYYALPDATGVKARHFNALLWGLCGLAVLYVGQVSMQVADEIGEMVVEEASLPADTYQIGLHTLSIPETYLRETEFGFFDSARTGAVKDTLELALVWPTLAPASRTRSKALTFGNGSNLVYLQIDKGVSGESLSDQIEPVYRRLATVPVAEGPAGLQVLTLSPGVDIEEDEIIFEIEENNRYAARCKRRAHQKQSICERSFQLRGVLTVTYRFEKPLLANWGRLERRARELVEASLVSEDAPVAVMKKASPTG
ncbi:hypothetical protein [Roseibium sediminis]|uniref:hypothetical protein n=1 Tax=Roseibium sediminis TaxID=1775174 RepID=UPI00123D85FF|nr:hypothetical protein [Roseibium sediminis]